MDFRRVGRSGPEAVRERMGSGGPRGLQIPRSGVKSVRGGFDSHAFPPSWGRGAWLVVWVAVGLALGGRTEVARALAPVESTGPAPGALVAPDSSAGGVPGATAPAGVPVDSAGSEERGRRVERRTDAAADTVRVRPRRGRFDTPRWVMLRSLVLPGWGQIHNRAWLKAVVLGGGELWIVGGLLNDDRRMRQLMGEADVARANGDSDGYNSAVDAYNVRLERFVSRQWLLGGLLGYALMDAYVDAHFRDFKVEFEYDRALKGGRPAAGQTRLSLRWAF